MNWRIYLVIGLIMLGCGPVDSPQQEPIDVSVESFVPPTEDEVSAFVSEMGGLAIGVTNPGLFVVDNTQLLAYKIEGDDSCRVRVHVQGWLTEPLVTLEAVYDASQTLLYESEFSLRRTPDGWKYVSLVEATLVPNLDADVESFHIDEATSE